MKSLKKYKKKLLKALAEKTEWYWEDRIDVFELMDHAEIKDDKLFNVTDDEQEKLEKEFKKLLKEVLKKMIK